MEVNKKSMVASATALTREGCYELTEGKLDNARRKLKKMRDRWLPEPVVEALGRDPEGWANYIVWTLDGGLVDEWIKTGRTPDVTKYGAEWLHQYLCGFITVGGRRYAYCMCQGCQMGGHGCYHVAEAHGKHLTWAMAERVGVILRPVARLPKPAEVAALIERVLPDEVGAAQPAADDVELEGLIESVPERRARTPAPAGVA